MRRDASAVAGFFEDLPVLLIVLAGVSVLVLSGAAASVRLERSSSFAEVEGDARRFVGAMVVSLKLDSPVGRISIASIVSLNISSCAADSLDNKHWSVAFLLIRQTPVWLRAEASSGDVSMAMITGYHSALLNVMMDDGIVCTAEVRALVWI